MIELAIFASQAIVVMLLGLQSRNVNTGQHIAAVITSFGIGITSLLLYKVVPDAGISEAIAYLLGGPVGILAAMWLHPRITKRRTGANINCGADRP